MSNVKKWLENKEYFLVGILVVLFILIRLPGVSMPLHQDEYKWPLIVNPSLQSDTSIPHPPLSQFIYRTAGQIVGYNVNFRFVPLFFGVINLVLLYYLIRTLYGKEEAIISGIIWIFSFYSVLASLMVDTDGEIMPFFFLLALIGYYKLLNSHTKKDRYIFGTILLMSLVLGFMVKVSFVLTILAIAADYIWQKRNYLNRGSVITYIKWSFVALISLLGLLLVSQKIFPFFNLSQSLTYWEHFATFDRGWFQTFIQCIKALLYSSPFLVLTPLFVSNDRYSRIRVFIFYLIFSFIFYIILFDFSLGALDRYLQLLVLPLTVLSTVSITTIFFRENDRSREYFLLGSIIALSLVFIHSLNHFVPPLHPKIQWIERIIELKWNFLYPFSGGSGPLGFYMSFLFMMSCWVISVCLLFLSKWKKHYRKMAVCILIPIGFVYNSVFIEEYLFGFYNGSAPVLLNNAVEYIKNDDDIKMVTVYNDNGGNEIQETGKYRKRLYVDPKFDIGEKIESLNKYKEHYFVLDIPRIDPNSIYQKYFDSCRVIYNETDRAISATIYDCTKSPDIKL